MGLFIAQSGLQTHDVVVVYNCDMRGYGMSAAERQTYFEGKGVVRPYAFSDRQWDVVFDCSPRFVQNALENPGEAWKNGCFANTHTDGERAINGYFWYSTRKRLLYALASRPLTLHEEFLPAYGIQFTEEEKATMSTKVFEWNPSTNTPLCLGDWPVGKVTKSFFCMLCFFQQKGFFVCCVFQQKVFFVCYVFFVSPSSLTGPLLRAAAAAAAAAAHLRAAAAALSRAIVPLPPPTFLHIARAALVRRCAIAVPTLLSLSTSRP